MFDCVMPTRAGRHGLAFTRHGKINLKNARHAEDHRPLDEESNCPAARDYSRAYLHHLVRSNEILGMMLITWNNLSYYQDLMAGIRGAIEAQRFEDFFRRDDGDVGEGRYRAAGVGESNAMKRIAIGLALLSLAGLAFGWWGLETEAGRRRFDEMAGIIPLLTAIGSLVLLVVAAILGYLARR